MTLSRIDAIALNNREHLITSKESDVIDGVFDALYEEGGREGLKLAKDDRAATLEAALIRFMVASRQPTGE